MFTSRKRAIYMILIACSMNAMLSILVYFLKLPMWLDTVGTIYISIIMGSSFGFCTGLVNNVVFSGFLYGYNSMSYYFVSYLVALVVGNYSKKHPQRNFRYWTAMCILIFSVSVPTASIFSLLLDGGIPADYWGEKLYALAQSYSCPHLIATIISVAIIKAIDVLISVIIVYFAIKFTPDKLLTDKHCVDLYKVRG